MVEILCRVYYSVGVSAFLICEDMRSSTKSGGTLQSTVFCVLTTMQTQST